MAAIGRLERMLGMASSGGGWLSAVTGELVALEAALTEEATTWTQPDALLRLIQADNPRRFGPRIRHLEEQLDDIVRQIGSLRGEVNELQPDAVDAADLRHRVGWLIRALRHYHARQTDLVYEALGLDLGDPRSDG